MGLYLCIFEDDEDIDGVDVGPYADFGALRDFVVRKLENECAGSRFPTLILHSDCDGEWTTADCEKLRAELMEISDAMKQLPPEGYPSDWQKDVAKSLGITPRNAFESFLDVDGEFLLERLQALVEKALKRQLSISFQ